MSDVSNVSEKRNIQKNYPQKKKEKLVIYLVMNKNYKIFS